MHDDEIIEIMNIQYNSLTQCTVKFCHWVMQVILKLFCLKLGLYSFTQFLYCTKTISDCHHFCKWKFLQSILQVAVSFGPMQMTLSIAIMQAPTSVAITQVLRFYCNYVSGTFCYTYVGKFLLLLLLLLLLQLRRWLFLLQLCS